MKNLCKILLFVIEDDVTFTSMICDLLDDIAARYKGINLSYSTFYSSKEAIFELSRNPDIILLDYYIVNDALEPDTGLEILRDVKKAGAEAKVLIVSGQANPIVANALLHQGADGYYPKNDDLFTKLDDRICEIIDAKIESSR